MLILIDVLSDKLTLVEMNKNVLTCEKNVMKNRIKQDENIPTIVEESNNPFSYKQKNCRHFISNKPFTPSSDRS